ncbi:hypothetical protein CsSME_00032822 [Camellia sinensis var. sinensis]
MELSGSNGNSLSYQPNKLDFDTHFSDEISEEVNDSPIEQVRLTVPYSALLDILNMGFGDFFMCYPDILEPILWALHDAETRPKGGLTRLEFFIAVLISSFSYFIVPNYLFPSITALFFVCWIWKDSVTAQQICSGLHGLGIGSFALDWSTVAGFLGSPLVTPGFAILNILVGYIAIVYVVIPIAYWTNWFEAKRFPIFSAHVFNDGGLYAFNRQGYESNSKIHLSIFFAFIYGLSFATLAATLSHVALFHGRYIFSSILYGFGMHKSSENK